ncbi:glycosyltransferase family 2 protein [Aeromonas veronii]|uniref:glycosyltransferase family 2 protein n=1 Tax=Aeromonas veronii TaxID=654 RepID=UPI003D1D038C
MFNLNLGLNKTSERLKFDECVGKFQDIINERKKTLPTLSAVFRVKNAETYLELSVTSIALICSEIIIVDNNSSDRTLEIANEIKDKLSNICDVKIYSYNKELAIAGENYGRFLTKENSLASYYDFAFSKATSEYVMKADAHLLYVPKALIKIQDMLKKNKRVIIFRGVEVYGMKLSFERYIFKNDGTYSFVDGIFYEELKFNYRLSKLEQLLSTVFMPCFIHFKRLRYISMLGANDLVEKLYK